MKNVSLVFIALIAVMISSCKNNTKQSEPEVVTVDHAADEAKVYEIEKGEVAFNDPKVEAIFKQYIEVEAALVNTNAAKTTAESAKLATLLKEANASEATQNAVAAMTATDDINVQRQNFETLSSEIEAMLKGALKSGTLYKQYCPMAFNNKGAYWISTNKAILNPYFGDKMLKCGRVDSEIK